MSNLLAIFTGVTSQDLSQVYTIPAGQTAESLAEQLGLSFLQWAEFDQAADFPGTESWPTAFELVTGAGDSKTVLFNLDKAKQLAESIVNAQSNEAAKATLSGLSYDVYVAQASLPAEQRIAKYQAAIDANNANALETEQREQAIYAATTIDQVYAIVYPPKP
jgi:hypothetical protein